MECVCLSRLYGVFIALLVTILFFSFEKMALADVDSGLMITHFSPTVAYAGDKTVITVGVLEVKTKDGSRGALDEAHPANNALVNLTLKKEEQEINLTLEHVKDGEYKGIVTFPEQGKWAALITARYKEHYGTDDTSQGMDNDVLDAIIEVKEPRTNGTIYWISGLIALGLLAVLYYRSQRKKQAT